MNLVVNLLGCIPQKYGKMSDFCFHLLSFSIHPTTFNIRKKIKFFLFWFFVVLGFELGPTF
jgi:hypothetical protein